MYTLCGQMRLYGIDDYSLHCGAIIGQQTLMVVVRQSLREQIEVLKHHRFGRFDALECVVIVTYDEYRGLDS